MRVGFLLACLVGWVYSPTAGGGEDGRWAGTPTLQGFAVREGEGVTVLSDADEPSVRGVREAIIAARKDVADGMKRLGIAPAGAEAPVVAILFAKREDYMACLLELEDANPGESTAYCSRKTGRIYLLAGNDPALAPVRTMQARHEATHQLLFARYLVRPDRDYPLWLVEGLAMRFEAEPNPVRLASWKKAKEAGRLDLRKVIWAEPVVDAPAERVAEWYAQAWMWTRFLWERHPGKLAHFIKDLNTSEDSDTRVSERHWGQMEALEREYALWSAPQ